MILLYLHASYYVNIFILYRPLSDIKTKSNEDIDRLLSMEEMYTIIRNLFNNII